MAFLSNASASSASISKERCRRGFLVIVGSSGGDGGGDDDGTDFTRVDEDALETALQPENKRRAQSQRCGSCDR